MLEDLYIHIYKHLDVKASLDCCSALEAAWKKPHRTTSIYLYIYREIL